MAKTLLLSGFDLREANLPDDTRLLLPPIALPGLEDFADAAERALDEPLSGEPLSSLLRPKSRVCVVLDDPSLPVPPLSHDPRRELLAAVLKLFGAHGIRSKQVTVLIANGLGRQWRNTELTDLLGIQSTAAFPVRCHDAEAAADLTRIGEEPEGPVELARSMVEADLVIHLNVVSTPLHAGLFGLVSGTAGYRTARFLGAPQLFEGDPAPLARGSKYHQIHDRVGALLTRKVRVLQLSAVLNNELWTPALSALFRAEHGLTRPLQMWNVLPQAVRHRAARLMRGACQPIAALSGPTEAVAPRALEVFYRQHEVSTDGPADVLLFGLPDQGPYSVRTAQNPVLAANLALGFIANLCSGKPLLKPGGVILFANPLTPEFDRKAHLPHEEFYEKVLRTEKDPLAIHERFEPYFAGRPEFVANYQRRFSFHGTHPLYAWYQCTPARKRAGRIIAAYGDPRACARLGFMPAIDVDEGLAKARDFLGKQDPSVMVLELPPPFFVRVR
ncbi:MAG: lactate racemase domain-containing protein [Myxococcaceae bacterium]